MVQLGRTRTHNRMLDALPDNDFALLRPHLETVSLAYRQVVFQPGDTIDFIYFPLKGVLSVLALLTDGSSSQVGRVGHEGVLGLSALLGDGISLHEVTVQAAGNALRGRPDFIRQEVERSPRFRDLLEQLSLFAIEEFSQNAACNTHHTLHQRCARWLLRMRDATEADEFLLSQEDLALMLGARRTGVTQVEQELRGSGFIEYRRGHVVILDPAGLEAAACECYRIVKDLRDRLFRDGG